GTACMSSCPGLMPRAAAGVAGDCGSGRNGARARAPTASMRRTRSRLPPAGPASGAPPRAFLTPSSRSMTGSLRDPARVGLVVRLAQRDVADLAGQLRRGLHVEAHELGDGRPRERLAVHVDE